MANSDYKVQNVIVGAAALYISTEDSTTWSGVPALPAGTAGTSLTSALDTSNSWRNVGFTENGLELNYQPTYGDVTVDQLLDSAKLFKSSMQVSLTTTLVEATLENLMVSWGQKGSTLASTSSDSTLGIAAGALGDEPVERSLVAVGVGPKSGTQKNERVYQARRCLSVQASAHSLRRDQATVFPVSFRMLPDTTAPADQEYGIVRDRNIS